MSYGKDTVEVMTDSQLDPIVEDVTYPNGEVVEDTHRVNFHACQINPSPTAQQLDRYQGGRQQGLPHRHHRGQAHACRRTRPL